MPLVSAVRSISSGSTVIGSSSMSGRDADALDRDVARLGQVLRDRELERRLVRQVGEDELHAALAEGRVADDDGAVVVLERAGHDLARARARPVDEDGERVVRLGAVAVGDLLFAPLARIAHGRDDRAVAHERVDHLRGLVEQPAGVAAQVEHEPLELAALLHVGERRLEIARRVRLELLEAHVADAAVEQLVVDGRDVDHLARQLERLACSASPPARRGGSTR